MKYLFILFFIITTAAHAQVVEQEKTFKVPLNTSIDKIVIEVDNTDKKITTKSDKTYYWFKSKAVHSTEGDYSGKLLHGEYIVHFKSNQLKEKGQFKYGLKHGEWVSWDEKGKKIEKTQWNHGVRKAEKSVVKEDVKSEKPEEIKEEEKEEKEEKEEVKANKVKKEKKVKAKKEKVKKEKLDTDKDEIKS